MGKGLGLVTWLCGVAKNTHRLLLCYLENGHLFFLDFVKN